MYLINIINTGNKPNIIMSLLFNFTEDIVILGVRVGTGKPSKTHIINNKNNKAYCGYDNFIAEVSIVTSEDIMFKPNFCKKCLNKYETKRKPKGF